MSTNIRSDISDSGLIYTTLFKAHNVSTESQKIQLNDRVWIENNSKFTGTPSQSSVVSLLALAPLNDLGLHRFFKELVNSSVCLCTEHTEQEINANPFQIHECSYIAIAIAILCDSWFVAGIETFLNSRDPLNPSYGPYTTFFNGSPGTANIRKIDEARLCNIYNFVYRTLTDSTWDSDDAKLLFLYLKCVAKPHNHSFLILKLGLDHLFTEWHSMIMNASLFFEHVFTKEARNPQKGAVKWNETYGHESQIDEKLVDIVIQYRHTTVHSNATDAQKKIDDWFHKAGLDSRTATKLIQNTVWTAAKTCMRTIINDIPRYREFQRTRPP